MIQTTQQRPRQVPRKQVPASTRQEPTQSEALLRDLALVLALTRKVKCEILSAQ